MYMTTRIVTRTNDRHGQQCRVNMKKRGKNLELSHHFISWVFSFIFLESSKIEGVQSGKRKRSTE